MTAKLTPSGRGEPSQGKGRQSAGETDVGKAPGASDGLVPFVEHPKGSNTDFLLGPQGATEAPRKGVTRQNDI